MLILLPGDSRWRCCYTFSHGYVESTVWQDVVTTIEMVLAGNYGSALLIKQSALTQVEYSAMKLAPLD